jgi:D-amino peptidase
MTALDERLYLITGSPRPQYMMPDFGPEYDLVFLVGYHSGTGALNGVMDHTYTSAFQQIRLQGQPMNEALMNSAYAGYHSVPVGLVIGDEALRQELLRDNALPWVQYVTTKRGLGRFAAKMRPLDVVRQETIEAVKTVLASDFQRLPRYRFEAPITLNIELQSTNMADIVAKMPLVKRLDGRTVELVMDDYRDLFDAREAIATLALTAR